MEEKVAIGRREGGREGKKKGADMKPYDTQPYKPHHHHHHHQVFQRQISKRELHSTLVEDAGHDVRNFSPDELRRLFVLSPAHVRCETYDLLRQGRREGGGGGGGKKTRWKDYRGAEDISDACLKSVVEAGKEGGKLVSFVHEDEDEEEEEKKEAGKRGGGEGGEEEEERGAASTLVCGAGVLKEGEEEQGDEWREGRVDGKAVLAPAMAAILAAKGKRKVKIVEANGEENNEEEEEEEEEEKEEGEEGEEESSEDEWLGDTWAGGEGKKVERKEVEVNGSKMAVIKHVALEEEAIRNGKKKEEEGEGEDEEWDALMNM